MVSRPLKDPRLWDPFHSWPIFMDIGQGGGDPITTYDTWEDPIQRRPSPPPGLAEAFNSEEGSVKDALYMS